MLKLKEDWMKEVLAQIGKSEEVEKSEESFAIKAQVYLAENQFAALQRLADDDIDDEEKSTPAKANPFISVKGKKKK